MWPNPQETRKSAFLADDSMIKKIDGFFLTSSINYKYIVELGNLLSTKTVDIFEYIKPMQRDFNNDV